MREKLGKDKQLLYGQQLLRSGSLDASRAPQHE